MVGYLRMPKGARPAPLIVAIAGLDSRKEEMVERFAPLAERAIAVLALDSPGTGESGVRAEPGVEASLTRMIDAALAHGGIDAKRIAVYGGSFGAYQVHFTSTECFKIYNTVRISQLGALCQVF